MYKIESVAALSLGAAAQTVRVNGLSCLVENNSDTASVYFKEKRLDGVSVTTENGWVLGPGEKTCVPMAALELSLVADAADTDVRVLILDEI